MRPREPRPRPRVRIRVRAHARARVVALALSAAALAAGTLAGAPAARAADARVLFTIQDPRIDESSGLAASVLHPGVLYTLNDSGDAPRFFAVGPDGRTRATFTLSGASARDWEAIATGRDEAGRPVLFLADIGDNLGGAWLTISVYRVREPDTLRDARLRATRFRFRYADGPRNAEALLVDPRTNRLYVASKERHGGLYEAPARLRTDRVNILHRVADVPERVTDGAFAPDGRRFVLRTYFSAYVYDAPGHEVASFLLPLQRQGESATFSRDGRALLVGSEGLHSEVWKVALPADAVPPPEPAGSPHPSVRSGGQVGSGERAGGGDQAEGGADETGIALLAAVAVVLAVGAARRRR